MDSFHEALHIVVVGAWVLGIIMGGGLAIGILCAIGGAIDGR